MATVAIHCEPRIDWQARRAPQLEAGLRAIGLEPIVTSNRHRQTYVAILLGTSCWRNIETDGDFLLVDRASYGDPDYVQLVWNGHGFRGDHRVPQPCGAARWIEHSAKFETFDWIGDGERVVLCGQTEPWSPHYERIEDWYAEILRQYEVTHFRQHPAGDNPTGLPPAPDWTDVGQVITLNSSIGVESAMKGIPTVAMDRGSMAYEVSSQNPGERIMPPRRNWLEWLAWTQWSWREIEAGFPIRHLFEGIQ